VTIVLEHTFSTLQGDISTFLKHRRFRLKFII
jgi:hypothetical protein